MKIAVEGCAHGELERIYDTIQGIEREKNIKVDLLLCCGDFQSTRNLEDLQTMAVPQKYQDICTFYKYYSGELIAPILTIFIGGNHEASNYLQELPYGGWVAPNIYYLGYAGVVRVNGVRIAGLSGIYKGHDFLRGRYEFSPYTDATRVSVYHVRQLEVFRLKQLSGNIDICMSHDWPRGIYNYGNKAQLVRFKPHFREEVDSNQLGSRPCEDLLNMLKPSMWFAAHLHCKFAALVPHNVDDQQGNDDEDDANDGQQFESERVTKFLALDKCLPRRRFLQLVDFDALDYPGDEGGAIRLEYDLEWLTILCLTNHLLSTKESKYYMPGPRSGNGTERYNFTPTDEELQHVRKKMQNDFRIPENFCRTVEPYNPLDPGDRYPSQPKAQINPQSTEFCNKLGIDDPVSLTLLIGGHELNLSTTLDSSSSTLNDTSHSMLLDSSDLSTSCINEPSPLKRKLNLSSSLPQPTTSSGADNDNKDDGANESTQSTTAADRSINPDELHLSSDDGEGGGEQAMETAAMTTEQCGKVAATSDSAQHVEKSKQPSTSKAEDKTNPPIKKFKRRNQDMYKAEEEEQNEQGHGSAQQADA